MNINKALEHFEWKFKHSWRPTATDIEAYNAILDYKAKQESYNLSQNENLAKLWIHQMILLSNTDSYSGTRCIEVVDEILTKSVYEWCLELKEQLPMMNFRALQKKLGTDDELKKALIYEISEANIIKFVEAEITRIIDKYEK